MTEATLISELFEHAARMADTIKALRELKIEVAVDNRSVCDMSGHGPLTIKVAWTSGEFLK